MEMFLMVVCMSVFGLAVTVIAFGAATNQQAQAQAAQPELDTVVHVGEGRFFGDEAARPVQPQVPVEALLLQIDSHVRLEQAAAESFLEYPTAALLHSRTVSPLVH